MTATLISDKGEELIIVCSFVPVERTDYCIGGPYKGRYKTVFNSDAAEFGGSGAAAASVPSKAVPMHGLPQSISLTLAPLSVLYLKPVPAKPRGKKKAEDESVAAEQPKHTARRKRSVPPSE